MFQRACLALFLLVVVHRAYAQSATLPPGPMQAKVKAACTQCHAATKITSQHMTRQQWDAQLDKMIGLGASIPDSDRKGFLNYLTKNFGSGNKPKTASKGESAQ